jgi:hypothetical protein
MSASLKPDTVVRLGELVFESTEVPMKMPFGGEQKLAAQELIGGERIVDAMGHVEDDITWSGRFRGANARARSRLLDEMRIAGGEHTLTWDEFSYRVAIKKVSCEYERFYEIPYTITVLVVKNNSATAAQMNASLDAQMQADAESAVTQAKRSGVQRVIDAAQTARDKISGVTNFIKSSLAQVTAVKNAVSSVIIEVQGAITEAESVWGTVMSIDDRFGEVADVVMSTASLQDVRATARRMAQNLSAFGQAGAVRTVAGGDLYRIAAETYGDPAEWVTIAAANPILGDDPTITGLREILVPALPLESGGVSAGMEEAA